VSSPNARTITECKKRGWTAQNVEQTIPHTFIKRDLFGVIDVIAVTPDGIIGIQATGDHGGDMQRRVRKIVAEPRALVWLGAARLAVWGWGKRGAVGKRKLWTLREIEITKEHFAQAEASQ
jgi:hypothetical protein